MWLLVHFLFMVTFSLLRIQTWWLGGGTMQHLRRTSHMLSCHLQTRFADVSFSIALPLQQQQQQ
jgi:hypothetical protein